MEALVPVFGYIAPMRSFDFAIATQLTQSMASLFLALLLWLFLRSRKQRYLRHLALAFTALGVYLACSALALLMSQYADPLGWGRNAFSLTALVALFPHLFWLCVGVRYGTRRKPGKFSHERAWIFAAAGFGALLAASAAWLATEGAPIAAHGLRFTLPYAVAGVTYMVLAAVLFRARSLAGAAQVSPLIAVGAFLSFGLYLLYAAGLSTWMVIHDSFLVHSQFVGLLGPLLLMLMGLSMVIWLLENEQRRALAARDQAQAAEQRLQYFRTHDIGTGLPNRQRLQDLIGVELGAIPALSDQQMAVLVIGIHRFKLVRKAVGWQQPEEILRALSLRIRESMPKRFTLGRVGERELVILMPAIRRRESAIDHARQILARTQEPFEYRGQDLFIKVSGGLSLGPDDSRDPRDLLNLAERAQLQAGGLGEDLLLHRASGTEMEPRDMLQVEGELRRAHREDQFKLYYQPLISIRQRRVTGFEALLRWEHPERGLLNPGFFLQDATALGVLDELEDQIFDSALRQLADWHNDLSLAPVSMSINLSAQRFVQPDLPDRLAAMCRQHGISPAYLDLEITESVAISDFEAGVETIARLREHGIKVSLDDFGTGYSALAHLQRLNVDYVKLDRSFVNGIDEDHRQLGLTRAIIELIHSLGMQVLAEGVENKAQLGHLIQCRVDFVQGYLLGPPRPAEDYRELLQQNYITAF